MNRKKGWHHSEETKRKIAEAQMGEKSNNWKGGCYVDNHGYIRVTVSPDSPFYPMCHKTVSRKRQRDITEHRLVMAQSLGRCLYPWEIVHHKNRDKLDNRLENLELLSQMTDHSPSMNYQRWVEQIKTEAKKELLNALRAKGMPTSPFMPNICKLFTLGDAPETERVIIIEQPGHIVFIPKEDKNGS